MNLLSTFSQRICKAEEAANHCRQWQREGKKVVFTNGCFDILHRGHLEYLIQAAELGDKLVIGLNSDDSIKRLKGPERPVNALPDRALALGVLQFVSLVVPFEEDTPFALIEQLQPNILVKGGDYTIDTIVGAKETLQRGGTVKVLPFVDGYSTTTIIERLRKS